MSFFFYNLKHCYIPCVWFSLPDRQLGVLPFEPTVQSGIAFVFFYLSIQTKTSMSTYEVLLILSIWTVVQKSIRYPLHIWGVGAQLPSSLSSKKITQS
jgi:hypothetical protein